MTAPVEPVVTPTRTDVAFEVASLLDAPEPPGEFRDIRAGVPLLLNLLSPATPRPPKK